MLDVTWTVSPHPSNPGKLERVIVLVDRATAHPSLLTGLGSSSTSLLLLWIVTPSAAMNWHALVAEPTEARITTMMAILGDHMERARRRLTPIKRAATAAGLSLDVRIAHGALMETAIRIAREERAQRIVIPQGWGEADGLPQRELIAQFSQRLRCPIETLPLQPLSGQPVSLHSGQTQAQPTQPID